MSTRRPRSRARTSVPSYDPALTAPAPLPEHIERAMAEASPADPWREEDEAAALSRRYGHLDLDRGAFNVMRTHRPSLTNRVKDLTGEVEQLRLDLNGGVDRRGVDHLGWVERVAALEKGYVAHTGLPPGVWLDPRETAHIPQR